MSAYLNTRVSLFRARLWHKEDFLRLLDASDAELAQVLREGGLEALVQDSHDPSARSLEQRVIAQVLEEIWILLRPLSGPARDFLLYWTRRWEISNLKTLLRGKMTGERPALLLSRLTPMGPFGQLDGDALAHVEDVGELLRRLETGAYSTIVRQAREAFEQNHDAFQLDAALDRAYYEGLTQRARPLEAELGADFVRLIGYYIDRINLVWLLRYRFNYHLPPAQVYYLLVNAHYGLPRRRLKILSAQADLAGVLAALPDTLRALLAGVQDIGEVARRMEQRRLGQAEAVLGRSGPAFTRVFAYLILRERRLRDVRAVLRGRQLHLPRQAIEDTLGPVLAGAA
ncbi:MAG: V-type ATPase subunit [Pseudomonadota bacterium]